jgi:hypothetical protein
MSFDPSEIFNPKKTLARREEEATQPAKTPAPASPKTMSQSEFGAGGPSQRQDPKKNAKFIELMRKQQQ